MLGPYICLLEQRIFLATISLRPFDVRLFGEHGGTGRL